MISAADWDAYNAAVAGMADGMAARAEAAIMAWIDANPGASVAEIREAAKSILWGVAQVADEAAATLAAEWYDERAREADKALEAAVTCVTYSSEIVDRVARYQARKLAEGDAAGFAKACGEFVRNDALKSLNATVIANVARDSRAGVRFARVTTGKEDCAFCLMLESRGAVYYTRKTAGEMHRFHRGCDCKVVPGFADDPMAVLVEGHDPLEAREKWIEVSDRRLFGRIDRFSDDEAKKAGISGGYSDLLLKLAHEIGLKVPIVEEWRSDRRALEVDFEMLESKSYAHTVKAAFGGLLPDTALDDVRRMLRHRSGTPYEDLYVYDMTTGARIGSVVTSKVAREVRIPDKIKRRIEEAAASGDKIAMMHNHPGSSIPSSADFAVLRASGASFGVIACHDGGLYRYSVVGKPSPGYNLDSITLFRMYDEGRRAGKNEDSVFEAIENELGVRIEHIRQS